MAMTIGANPLYRTRLAACLHRLCDLKSVSQGSDIALQLGKLFDLADSVRLCGALSDTATATPSLASATNLQDDFMQARKKLLRQLLAATEFGAANDPTRTRFPSPQSVSAPDELMHFALYSSFYLRQQRKLDGEIARLYSATRDGVASLSTELAQLAQLDQALYQALNTHWRAALGQIPALLQRRFVQLVPTALDDATTDAQTAAQWLRPDGWLARFRDDIRELLLAELELRLQPVIGLIEAINDNSDHIESDYD